MNRLLDAMPSTNGKHTSKGTKVKANATAKQPRAYRADCKRWALFGVAFMSVLSAGLNGYANAQHSPVAWAGWLMGFAVPVIVLTLGKVCGEQFRAGRKPVAWFAGGAGVSLLMLSVWHCASSIALLTGSGLALSVPMALAIDAGLVACEAALIAERK